MMLPPNDCTVAPMSTPCAALEPFVAPTPPVPWIVTEPVPDAVTSAPTLKMDTPRLLLPAVCPPKPINEIFPLPVVLIVAEFSSTPTKLPAVAPAFAKSCTFPSAVVMLDPLVSAMFRNVVSEIAPVPVAERSEFVVARLTVSPAETDSVLPVAIEMLLLKVTTPLVSVASPGRLRLLLNASVSAPVPVFTVRLAVSDESATKTSFAPFCVKPVPAVIACVASAMCRSLPLIVKTNVSTSPAAP